jgi:hypothetical protein
MTRTSELYEATGRLYDQRGYYHGSADVPSLVGKINAVTAQRDRLAEACRAVLAAIEQQHLDDGEDNLRSLADYVVNERPEELCRAALAGLY